MHRHKRLCPSEGRLEVDRTGPLLVDGREVPIDGYPRFDNPFASATAGQSVIDVECDGARLRLDLRRRDAS